MAKDKDVRPIIKLKSTAGTGYTYDEATGQFATVPGVITVPAATFTQGADGAYTRTPGLATLVFPCTALHFS